MFEYELDRMCNELERVGDECERMCDEMYNVGGELQ